jgi:hypothetical protein
VPPTIRFEGGTRYHKAVRNLTEEEYAALKADIERDRKIYTPIVIDRYGNIVDGAHRAKIGRELGIEVPFQVVDATVAELKALAIRLNLCPMAYEPGMSIQYDCLRRKVTIHFRGQRIELPGTYESRDEGVRASEEYCRQRGWAG